MNQVGVVLRLSDLDPRVESDDAGLIGDLNILMECPGLKVWVATPSAGLARTASATLAPMGFLTGTGGDGENSCARGAAAVFGLAINLKAAKDSGRPMPPMVLAWTER
jgi:hypothetical protein